MIIIIIIIGPNNSNNNNNNTRTMLVMTYWRGLQETEGVLHINWMPNGRGQLIIIRMVLGSD